nr:pilus assembly protein TadG-related protein [Flexivirga endophytica]
MTASVMMVILVGLAVDLTGQVHAEQRARDVAAQAARAAGEQVTANSAIRGDTLSVNTTQAAAAAEQYLAAAGVHGSVTVHGSTLTVTTHDQYATKFLSVIGLNSFPVTGHSTAHLERVQNGARG